MGKPRTHKKKTKQSNKLNSKNIIRINIGTHKKNVVHIEKMNRNIM